MILSRSKTVKGPIPSYPLVKETDGKESRETVAVVYVSVVTMKNQSIGSNICISLFEVDAKQMS